MTLIDKINPINKEAEKKKFIFDPLYNPQFEYSERILPDELHAYMPYSEEYLGIAEKIVHHITKLYGSHEQYLEMIQEPLLTNEEVRTLIHEYLEREKLTNIVTIDYSTSAVARTSTAMNVLTVRLPTEYSKSALLGMLNHELGTHNMRSLNDTKQIWHHKGDKFHLHPHLVTEEGLAVLNAQLSRPDIFLRRPALHYMAVCYANTHSFSQLNTYLKPFVPDQDRRWTFCLRAKRGIKDTSLPGAFTKDQTYLAGAIKVWRWLKLHQFDPTDLYIGKVAFEDVDTLKTIANREQLQLPTFITKNKQRTEEKMQKIGRDNFFEKTVSS